MASSMHALFIFVAFHCIHDAWLQPCMYTEMNYLCKEIPTDYPAGLTSVIIFVGSLGEISLSMFNSTNLISVNSLTMIQQGITAIELQTFDKFQNLKTINLDNNHLSQVSSGWFSHQDTLETLILSNNKITALDYYSLDGLSNLLMLDLSNNKLTHLSKHLLLPLNGTKIRLDGNPWDCACSVKDFATYLRGLKNASLLENEMLVCCDSPPDLKGVPVWQVQECKSLTSTHPTTTSAGNSATGNHVTILINKPLTIEHSTLIILIVVLCALVLVICVLSVLYHRKRERKHLQAVKPSEKSEIIQASETTAKSTGEENRKIKSEIANKTQFATPEVLLRTNQMVVGDEKSQIYHIYSSGTSKTREPIKRVRSAGPVLCQTHMLAKVTEMETATEENGLWNNEYYNKRMTSEKQEYKESIENNEDTEKLQDRSKITDKENEGFTDKSSNKTGTLETHKEKTRESNEDTDECIKARTNVYKDVPQCGLENDVFDHIGDLAVKAGSSQDILQVKHVSSHFEENTENLPYFSIGADPENQRSGVNLNTVKGVSGTLRPIRRVLSWPPTAAQWKKQWAQNQQVINLFPKLIFVTGCMHEVSPFHPSVSPATFPTTTQFNEVEFLPEIMSPVEDVQVAFDEAGCKASLESCTQKVLHFSPQECFSNVGPNEDDRVNSNEETWRSGLESNIDFQDVSSKNSPVDESEVCSELISIFNPSFGGSKSKSAVGKEIINKHSMKEMQSVKKKTHRVQVRPELLNQSERAENVAPKASRDRRQGQVCSNSDSRSPTSGGSPKDDSLLLGNEYTFIDLLHEVAENNGRWTRERWRETQKNKHKLKQGPSH